MYELYDRVRHIPTGKPCFVIDVDEGVDEATGVPGVLYGLEAEDQDDPDWFYWAEDRELEKLTEHD